VAGNAAAAQSRQMTRSWLMPTLAIVVVAVALAVGAGIATVLQPDAPATAARTFTGPVTVVDEDGTAFCIAGTDAEAQYCSEAYLPPGAPGLQVGERITGTVAVVRLGDVTQEVFIVTGRQPPPLDDGA
jgi:hypothetical protein